MLRILRSTLLLFLFSTRAPDAGAIPLQLPLPKGQAQAQARAAAQAAAQAAQVQAEAQAQKRLLAQLLGGSNAVGGQRQPTPPPAPASPLFAERNFEPVSTPAGTLTLILVVSFTRPSPPQVEQAFSTFFPLPWQVEQVCLTEKKPLDTVTCP